MRYYLDTEFNAFGGELISLALVREDGRSLYLVYKIKAEYDPWVAANVVPKLFPPGVAAIKLDDPIDGALHIAEFLREDEKPVIITDWPDDIRYFCAAIITAPGYMADIKGLKFEMIRVDAYPSKLPGANDWQHNAYWDAKALRQIMLF